MEVQVLFSAMFQGDDSLPFRSNVKDNYLVVNQTDYTKYPNINNSESSKFFISTTKRGLSNSRNIALKYAKGDICLIADDDLEYLDGYDETVRNAYEKHPDADLILFDFLEPDSVRKRKKVAKRACKLNYLQILRGNSVRISFKLKSVRNNNMKFNPFFGAGSDSFTSGEDIVFLTDCMRKKMNIYYEPIPILKLKDNDSSTWFVGFNEQYFNNIGAFSYYYARKLWPIYGLQFLLRHLGIIKQSDSSVFRAWFALKDGAEKYQQIEQR